MDIKQTTQASSVIFHLNGRFDAHEVAKLKSTLEPVKQDFELNMQGVNFIDSSGLALLVSLYKKAREAKINMTISHLQDTVRVIFEVTKLDMVLPINDNQKVST